MSAEELLVRVLTQVQPMLPYMAAVAGATILALLPLLALSRDIWMDQGRFRWLGLFYSLGTGESVCLACVWIKVVLLISLLVDFRKPAAARYMLFLIPAALYALWPRRFSRLPVRAFWIMLESAALLSCGLICGYIHDMHAGQGYRIIYVAMALFTALFGIYLFFMELDDISSGRKTDIEQYGEKNTAA